MKDRGVKRTVSDRLLTGGASAAGADGSVDDFDLGDGPEPKRPKQRLNGDSPSTDSTDDSEACRRVVADRSYESLNSSECNSIFDEAGISDASVQCRFSDSEPGSLAAPIVISEPSQPDPYADDADAVVAVAAAAAAAVVAELPPNDPIVASGASSPAHAPSTPLTYAFYFPSDRGLLPTTRTKTTASMMIIDS